MRLLRLMTTASIFLAFAGTERAAQQSGPVPLPSASSSQTASASPTAPSQPAQGQPAAQPAPVASAVTQPVSADASSPSKPAAQIEMPSGTHIPLVLHNAISTRSAQPGDPVYFETSFPVMLNGKIIVPAGSWVSGEVTEAKRPGRVKGRAELMIRLKTLILPNAYVVNLTASPSNAGTGGNETTNKEGKITGDSDKTSDAGTVMKTTAAGAGIGALAGRSAKGAGIGAGIGAATGLAAVLLSRGPEAELPRGTTLDAVLDHSVMLDASKVQFTNPGQASALPGPPDREPQRSKVPF